MRELKDYFCTYEQTQELIRLGLSETHEITAEHYKTEKLVYIGFLLSQALDFFRELGYEIRVNSHAYNKHWFSIIKSRKTHVGETINNYQKAESEAISLCIELEKEARNG